MNKETPDSCARFTYNMIASGTIFFIFTIKKIQQSKILLSNEKSTIISRFVLLGKFVSKAPPPDKSRSSKLQTSWQNFKSA